MSRLTIEYSQLDTLLNEAKSRLDQYYVPKNPVGKAWTTYFSYLDQYKQLPKIIETDYNAQRVSNAWLKFWEIYHTYPLIKKHNNDTFTVFFNAELPGSSLCAYNHYVKTIHPKEKFEWRASSLIGLGAFEDVYGLYARNQKRWLMNDDNNGDSTNIRNLLNFESRLKGIDLYCHDAGLDVTSNYNEQERLNAALHLGCAIAGFLTLKIGGSFVAKQYTFFCDYTWKLIMLYSTLFDQFHFFKPETSRPTNSEIYLIGLGYRGITSRQRNLLFDLLEAFNRQNYETSNELLRPFKNPSTALMDYGLKVFGRQIERLNQSVEEFEKLRSTGGNALSMKYEEMSRINDAAMKAWINRFPLKWIKTRDHIPDKDNMNPEPVFEIGHIEQLCQALATRNHIRVATILAAPDFYVDDTRMNHLLNDSALIMRSAVASGCRQLAAIILNDDRIYHGVANRIAYQDAVNRGQPDLLNPKILTLKLVTLYLPQSDYENLPLDPLSKYAVNHLTFQTIYQLSNQELADQLNKKLVPVIPRTGKYLASLILTFAVTGDQLIKTLLYRDVDLGQQKLLKEDFDQHR
ncbi:FtsJ methyltransferase [uncultured virus]|nr:FtsJ methyltransferase [uncultured virus]